MRDDVDLVIEQIEPACAEAGRAAGGAALDVRDEVQRAYNEWLQEELRDVVRRRLQQLGRR